MISLCWNASKFLRLKVNKYFLNFLILFLNIFTEFSLIFYYNSQHMTWLNNFLIILNYSRTIAYTVIRNSSRFARNICFLNFNSISCAATSFASEIIFKQLWEWWHWRWWLRFIWWRTAWWGLKSKILSKLFTENLHETAATKNVAMTRRKIFIFNGFVWLS